MPISFPNSPTNGQTVTISGVVYSWNSTKATWDLVSGVSTLDQLLDVTAPTPADNNLLAYDTATSNWTNQTAAQAGVAAASHTHPQSDITNLVTDLAGKAATSHTHPQSAITNLVSDLAGKAATSHTHNSSDISTTITVVNGDYWVGQDSTTNGRLVRMNSNGASSFFVQNWLANVGDRMDIIQSGTGTVTFAGSGVTLRTPGGKNKLNGQWSAASVICIVAGTEYVLIGDLKT